MSRRTISVALGAALAVLLVVGVATAVGALDRRTATVYFASTTGLYPGDEVRILGVPVGVVDAIVPDGAQVRVELHYDADQDVPADAKAAIVATSLVSSRYIQLAPRYVGGPVLADGAVIPLQRTATPVEWDQIKDQLLRLSQGLGPVTADDDGSLARLLAVGAETLDGQGAGLNATLKDLANASSALADGGDDLFATVDNLQLFTTALASSDKQIEEFGTRLAAVSGILAENRGQLGEALHDLQLTVVTVQQFVAENRGRLGTTVDRLAGVTGILAAQQEDLAGVLHAAPTPLVDLYNAYLPSSASLHGQAAVTNLANPGLFVCSAIAAAGNSDPQDAAQRCSTALGPLLSLLTLNYPPGTIAPVRQPGSDQPLPSSPRAAQPPDAPSDAGPPLTGPGGLSELLTPGGGS